jgi:hypothetical protein
MRKANIWAAAVCCLWAALVWIGIDLVEGVVHQHVVDYPSDGQITGYILLPAIIVFIVSFSAIVLNSISRWGPARAVILGILSTLAFLLLLPYVVSMGGGV